MKVERNDNSFVEFDKVSHGDVIEDSDGGVYIVIDKVYDDDEYKINAVDLVSGCGYYIRNNELVRPLKARLVVE